MENNNSRGLSILIADDHHFVLELLKLHVASQHIFNTIETADSKKDVLNHLEKSKYDIILLDIMFKDGNITEDLKNISLSYPDTKVILLSGINNKKTLIECYKAGIRGFILKSSHQSEVTEAIQFVLKGDKYYCKECLNILVEETIEHQEYVNYIDDNEILTGREKEILQYIVDELSVKEIADKLCISQRTAETHKRNIMEKLGTKTTLGLVKKVIMKNLLNGKNKVLVHQ